MAFCRQCGNEVVTDARFCRSCGAAVSIAPTAAVSSPLQASGEARHSDTLTTSTDGFRSSNRSLPIMAVIGAIMGVVLITAGYIQYSRKTPDAVVQSMQSKSSDSEPTEEETESVGENEDIPETEISPQNQPVPEPTQAEPDVPLDWTGEKFPQTRLRLLTENDINDWSFARTRYAINEMYARYGLDFRDQAIEDQFRQFSWYKPQPGLTTNTIESQFSEIEMKNMRLLAKRRNSLSSDN